MTLIRAPWQATDQAFNTPVSCPLYCRAATSETWDLGNITLVGGKIRSTSTVTGSNGSVLVVNGPAGTDLGQLAPVNCFGIPGIGLNSFDYSLSSTSPVMSTSHPYTVEFWCHSYHQSIPTPGATINYGSSTSQVDMAWYFDMAIQHGFLDSYVTTFPSIGPICTVFAQAPKPIVKNPGCFKIRLSVDPCNHKYTVKVEGAQTGFVHLGAGINWQTVSCVEITRLTGSPIADPNGSGFNLDEARTTWPNLYGCENPEKRLWIRPVGISFYRVAIRSGYEVC